MHKTKQTRKCTKTHEALFVLACPGVSDIPSDTPLEKVDFPFTSSCQLQRVPWLLLGLFAYNPFSVLESNMF